MRNYLLKVFKGKEVKTYRTRSIRRFFNYTRTIKFLDSMFRVYIRVSDDNGYNDGTYDNKTDYDLALRAFIDS